MWFEPLAEVGTLLAGCAAMLGAALPLFKKSYDATNYGIVTVKRMEARK
ncbi:hypothetical protein [Leisingera sp. F5]|nr:hypothetical protein [Leisingera sp. F5]